MKTISEAKPITKTLTEALDSLNFGDCDEIPVGFTPEILKTKTQTIPEKLDSPLFVRGDFPIEKNVSFKFPILAQT
ncbi:hypothetical protein [Leptospira perolatii]|nr:hypothetical protein [Leptospira perolatii]